MAYDAPAVVSSYALGDGGAPQLWNWLLRRHGLAEDTKFDSVFTAMNESARRFVAVHAPWCESPLYMYDDRHDEFQDMVPQPRVLALNFLAHEDVALKAYFESRGRYLGQLPPRRAFNQIGEVLPTIMHRGQVIGTWTWDASKMAVTYSIMRGYGSPELSKEARRQANALSQTLRLRWV